MPVRGWEPLPSAFTFLSLCLMCSERRCLQRKLPCLLSQDTGHSAYSASHTVPGVIYSCLTHAFHVSKVSVPIHKGTLPLLSSWVNIHAPSTIKTFRSIMTFHLLPLSAFWASSETTDLKPGVWSWNIAQKESAYLACTSFWIPVPSLQEEKTIKPEFM